MNDFVENLRSVPMTAVQIAMLRRTLGGEDGANIEQVEMVFGGNVAPDRVVAAWDSTVARTAALRVAFRFEAGEPAGLQALPAPAKIQVERAAPESWSAWLADDRRKSLPLDGGCPWRATFWPEARRFVWTFHHALLDGRSIARILAAFQERLGGGADPGELKWTAVRLPTAEEIAAAGEFHRAAFADVTAGQLEFPSDLAGTPAKVSRTLGAAMVSRLEDAARRMDSTAATLVTWAWGQAISLAAGAPRVAVGQVRSGPSQPAAAGFSMATVTLVIERAAGDPVETALRNFRERLLEMRRIEHVPLEDLPAGIFQETGGPWPGGIVMVSRGTMQREAARGSAVESLVLHEQGGETLLASAWIHPELTLEVDVDGTVFGPEAAECLVAQWAAIVRALATENFPTARDFTTLTPEMRESLDRWETSGPPAGHRHFAAAWKRSVEKFRDRPALVFGDLVWSYADLDARAEHLAAALEASGIGAGATVASILWQRKHVALVQIAVARVGAIHVPLDPALPENRIRTILADAQPQLLLSDDPAQCRELSPRIVPVDGGTGEICTAPLPDDPRTALSILYTSGSTGRPKGVMMVHGGVTNEGFAMAGLAEIQAGDRVLQFASPGFDASLEEMTITLLSGAALFPRPEILATDLDEFHNFLGSSGITVLDLSTAHWVAWCAWMGSEGKTIPACVRSVIIGGERAAATAIAAWFRVGGCKHLLINTYGPTEASVVGTAELIRGDWNEPGDPAIGRPLAGVHARVGDAAGNRVLAGAAGELWLGGICVGDGYWQRPDLTAAAFHEFDGRLWYRTGDRVCWDADGKLRFLGRWDDQLKIRGNRVEPNEVIRVLEAFPGVVTAFAGPAKNPDGSILLGAWVRWESGPQDGWSGELAAHAAAHLPAAAVPSRWAAVAEFSLTERGKLDRSTLPEPILTASTRSDSGPPATPTEKRLAQIWSELLGISVVGRGESFFELGGHSLMALQLFARIGREWSIRIPMAMLMQAPSPRLLGALIDEKISAPVAVETARPVIVPVREEGEKLPLFCIHGGDGGVFFYLNLAAEMPPGRPLLAIESPALSAEGEVDNASVEETAVSYFELIRERQPTGPYHLAGYSFGGLLVIEVARSLIAAGESVAFAGLFDTVNPATPIREYSLMERIEVYWESQERESFRRRISRLLIRAREGIATHLRVKGELRAVRSGAITEPYSEARMLQVRESHWLAMKRYQPALLDARITLFKSNVVDDKFEIPDDYGWQPAVASLEVVNVPGKHLDMFDMPHVRELSVEIAKRL